MFRAIISILISYLIGAIPTAYIFGKIYKGIDIREHGSGNVGATNVFRTVGKVPGIVVLGLDILKGIIPVVFVSGILGVDKVIYLILISLSAVCGHNWTIFLNFKGGKGIATTLGVLIGLTIKITSIIPVILLTVIVWALCFLLTKIVSLSSIVSAVLLPVIMLVFYLHYDSIPFEMVALSVVFCIFIVIRHKPNIKRLLAKEEPRIIFSRKKNPRRVL